MLLLDHGSECHWRTFLNLNFLCPSSIVQADGGHVSQEALANPKSSQHRTVLRSSSLMLQAANYTLT